MISNKEAFDRLTSRGALVDPLLRKALLHLGERLTDMEELRPDPNAEPSPGVYEWTTEPLPEPELVQVPKAYEEWSFGELRAECKALGLSAGGTAQDLVDRLVKATS